ncbi:carbon-nitrogen hydrolase family protein [Hahella ganghwensis]|uniref:carbon-nitrogen hydrolase family protein n=1 Tax=Hahella ganghwensis TaxID=286420 RepID=UPI00036F0086|nr:carbon-nitrogen hydrolase family protein [Hahella ganghwensis]
MTGQSEPNNSPNCEQPDSLRVGSIQLQMKQHASQEAFLENIEHFLVSMAGYGCRLVVLPEFFSLPLAGIPGAAGTNSDSGKSNPSIESVASLSQAVIGHISSLAVRLDLDVLAGSVPVLEHGELFNIAYFCRSSGEVESQRKIHPTPYEREYWNIKGGDQLPVFETDYGRVGVLICYDVEFPELGRLLADQNMDLLLVPFWTDNRQGYLRVRYCAQARAIENECYVVLSGTVGTVPAIEMIDNQFAQSAVLSPSDYGFPRDGIVEEATANQEVMIVADLDLKRLRQFREKGTVSNLKDRRHDLYQLGWARQQPF